MIGSNRRATIRTINQPWVRIRPSLRDGFSIESVPGNKLPGYDHSVPSGQSPDSPVTVRSPPSITSDERGLAYLRSSSTLSGMGRLIILSGPSCFGKGPLHAAFSKFYPELAAGLRKLVLYNCRAPRPGEIDGKDYRFRSREEIQQFRQQENFIVLDVRGDLQAVDMSDLDRGLAEGDLFFEGNPFIGRKLLEMAGSKVTLLSVFLAPISREEILFLQAPERSVTLPDFLTDVMRRKLLRRTPQ